MKQPAFDELVGRFWTACGQVDRLSHELWQALKQVGLPVDPAMRISAMADQMRPDAQDLKRRQGLLHELERRRIDVPRCTPQGEFWHVPDDLTALQARLDGLDAADLARRAAAGDHAALAQLAKYGSEAAQPEFARALLQSLGAKEVTELPAALATQLRGALDHGENKEARTISTDGKTLLQLLSTALATGTDPMSSGFVGDPFLRELQKQGRTPFDIHGVHFYGYQSLAMLLRAARRSPSFSPHFMEIVGRDAVVFERELYSSRWAAAKGKLGRTLDSRQVSMLDLSSMLGLGGMLVPGQAGAMPAGEQERHSVIDDLLYAAGASRESAQSLLDYTPQGWKRSVLTYLLTTRLGAFHDTNDSGGIGSALLAALGGHDATSERLTGEALAALKDQIGSCYTRGSDGKLALKADTLNELAFLRYPLGHAMAVHIGKVSQVYEGTGPGFPGIDRPALAKELIFVTRDDEAFNELIQAEAQRMWRQIKDGSFAHKANAPLPGARVFGSLLEARRLGLYAESKSDDDARAALRSSLQTAIGYLGVLGAPGATLGEKAASKIGGAAGGKLDGFLTGKAEDWLVNRMMQPGLSMDEALQSTAKGRELVHNLMYKMIASYQIAHTPWSAEDLRSLRGKSFATHGDPPRIKPLDALNQSQLDAFIRWAQNHTDIESVGSSANRELDNSGDDGFHNDLGVDRY